MNDNIPAPKDGEEPEQESPRLQRLRWFLQGLNLLAAALLILAFVVYVVIKQTAPVYQFVADTPVESFCLRLVNKIQRYKSVFHSEVRNKSLLPEEEAAVQELIATMARTRPQHAIALKSGEQLFGNLRSTDSGDIQFLMFDGQAFKSIPLEESDITFRKLLVFPDEELTAADKHFMLRYKSMNHFFLPPYLFATESNFARVHTLYMALSTLADEFRREYGQFVPEGEPRHVHICFLNSESAFYEEAAKHSELALVNAIGFFSHPSNCLYLYDQAAGDAPKGTEDMLLTIRHEGAHQLAYAFDVFARFEVIPMWLLEGLAQHCESTPFGESSSEHLALLRTHAQQGTLLPWQELMAPKTSKQLFVQEKSKSLAYAQAWILYRTLMSKPHKTRFFQYLLTASPASNDDNYVTELMNVLQTTPSKFLADVEKQMQQGAAQ